MEIIAEGNLWYSRKVVEEDVKGYFSMDKQLTVHQYLGNNPMTSIDQAEKAISSLIQQHKDNGIARWAVISKEDDQFIGWSGLKYEISPFDSSQRYYDIGYRLHPAYWGKRIAKESAIAALDYGFNKMNLSEISAAAHQANGASNHILSSIGLLRIKSFEYYNLPCYWYTLNREKFLKSSKT